MQHLRSIAHEGTKEITCPSCLKQFKSLHSLAAHVESESQKCRMRKSKTYGLFLDQLSWGTVEIDRSKHGYMLKYKFQDGFQKAYGRQKIQRQSYGLEQGHGTTELTAGAFAKQQQEQHQGSYGGGGGDSVSMTAEALSLLDVQEEQAGMATWARASVDDPWHQQPPGNVFDQPSGPPMVQQQARRFWHQPSQTQEEQKQGGNAWDWSSQTQEQKREDDGWFLPSRTEME